MKTFKLDEYGDLQMDHNHNIRMVEDADEILQSIRLLLSINQGEWFLRTSTGFAQYEILGKKQWRDDVAIKDAVLMTLRQEPRIKKVISLTTEFDKEFRSLRILFSAEAKNGETINDSIKVVW